MANDGTGEEMPVREAPGRIEHLAVAGGLLGALAVSSCCILPLALFGLGVSGAWIGKLTALAPYQPYLIAFAGACIGFGYWSLSRARRTACTAEEACASARSRKLTKVALVMASLLVAAALALDVVGPALLAT